MYKHTMLLTYLNLKTSASFNEEYLCLSYSPLVTIDVDLFGKEILKFDFENKSWEYFSTILNSIKDKHNIGLSLKAERAIKRRLKGTAKGIQVVYRDSEDLIWHVIINFQETLEVSNNN